MLDIEDFKWAKDALKKLDFFSHCSEEDLVTLAEGMEEGCECSKIHGHCAPPEFMRSDPREFIHQYAYHLCALRHLHLQSLFHAKCACVVIDVRREVIHPACYIYELAVG